MAEGTGGRTSSQNENSMGKSVVSGQKSKTSLENAGFLTKLKKMFTPSKKKNDECDKHEEPDAEHGSPTTPKLLRTSTPKDSGSQQGTPNNSGSLEPDVPPCAYNTRTALQMTARSASSSMTDLARTRSSSCCQKQARGSGSGKLQLIATVCTQDVKYPRLTIVSGDDSRMMIHITCLGPGESDQRIIHIGHRELSLIEATQVEPAGQRKSQSGEREKIERDQSPAPTDQDEGSPTYPSSERFSTSYPQRMMEMQRTPKTSEINDEDDFDDESADKNKKKSRSRAGAGLDLLSWQEGGAKECSSSEFNITPPYSELEETEGFEYDDVTSPLSMEVTQKVTEADRTLGTEDMDVTGNESTFIVYRQSVRTFRSSFSN